MTSILTPEEVDGLIEAHEGEPADLYPHTASDRRQFAAALESAILAKLAARAGELPPYDCFAAAYTDAALRSHTASLAAENERVNTLLLHACSERASLAARVEVLERLLREAVETIDTLPGYPKGAELCDRIESELAALFPAKKD